MPRRQMEAPGLVAVGPIELRRTRRDMVSLSEAIDDVSSALDGAIVLGWSASDVIAGVIVDGVVEDERGSVVDTSEWFEAKVFNSDIEVRWLRRPDGGVAVIVSEQPMDLTGWDALPPVGVTRIDGVTSLLWGMSLASAGSAERGWVELTSARVGTRAYPLVDATAGSSVVLESSEYVARGKDGNAVVIDERVRGLRVQSTSEVPDA